MNIQRALFQKSLKLDTASSYIAVSIPILVLLVQHVSGAYSAEMTTGADEAAHFLSGIMVRDYILGELGSPPVAYAYEYYSHYPKIGIGNWPPLYYLIQALWFIVMPVSRQSSVLLLGLMVVIISLLIYRALRPSLGVTYAALGSVLFVLLRPVPAYTSAVMAEIPLACFFMCAVFFWMRFVDTERRVYLFAFAGLSAATILLKGNGLALVLVPIFSILISAEWKILRSRAVWLSAAAVALLALPWIIYYLPTMRGGWALPQQLVGNFTSITFYPRALALVLGPVVLIALWGMWVQLSPRPTRRTGQLMWHTAFAAILAGVAFHTFVPGGLYDIRHLIMIYPFLSMFIAAGSASIARSLDRVLPNSGLASPLTLGVVLLLVFGKAVSFNVPRLNGFRPAAVSVFPEAATDTSHIVALVSSDAAGEGAFVVQSALRDERRPFHTVWRASKLLAKTTWAGRDYQLREETLDGILLLLDRANVNVIVLDQSSVVEPHQRLLQQLLEERPDRFVLRRKIPLLRNKTYSADAIQVYDVRRPMEVDPGARLRQVPGYDGVLDPLHGSR